jgi:chromate transporter
LSQGSDGRRGRLRELAAVFTKLGFTAFGGPAVHVGLMESEIVTRRGWIDRQHFLDMVAAVNFVPGPNSTELAIHVGQLRAGFAGLLVAGACFIAPAMLIILPIAWGYVRWGALPALQPALRSVGAAVVAVVAIATLRFGRTAVKDPFAAVLAALTAVGAAGASLWTRVQPEIPALAVAAVAGTLWYGRRRSGGGAVLRAVALPLVFWREIGSMALYLLKIGGTLFGSGYVLVSYLQSDFVDRTGWLTQRQFLDAIAVGQFTPGPLLTTATFVGYLLGAVRFGGGAAGGIAGGVAATVAIFLPSFVIVAIFGPMLQRLRAMPWARAALDGMNAGVVGLMAAATVRLALPAVALPGGGADWLNAGLLAAALVALANRVNATWVILTAGMLGTAVMIASR